MPRELPKSWSYLHEGWNTSARTPVTSAIETAVSGDAKSVTFKLFSDGLKAQQSTTPNPASASSNPNAKKQKKNNNKGKGAASRPLRLNLPENFDVQVHKIAALSDRFNVHHDGNGTHKLYGEPVIYKPAKQELDHIMDVIKKVVADPAASNLSTSDIYRKYIVTDESLGSYRGDDWDQWFLEKLNRIKQQPTPSLPSARMSRVEPLDRDDVITQELKKHGVRNPEIITFIADLSRLVRDDTRSPFLLVDQWRRILALCSSHWIPPPLWWCVGSTLVGDNLLGMTRPCKEGGVFMPATCLENWDMILILQLLESNVFPDFVREAARKVKKYPRTDLAHERFDCDWHRDWTCMADLLNALDCSSAAAELREFCEPKTHTSDGGESFGFE